ncbi:hypothetical protein LguiB_020804 [Lonicera macranthoides]
MTLRAQDVAETALFLASDESSPYYNGLSAKTNEVLGAGFATTTATSIVPARQNAFQEVMVEFID